MYRRTPDVVESWLEWAGYGLGYSEEEAHPVDEQAARAAPAAKPAPAVRPAPVVRPVLAAPVALRPADPVAPPLRVGRDQRFQVWYDLGEGLVERWDQWKAGWLVSMARRWQTWTDDFRVHAGELRGLTDRSRAQGRQLWSTWHSRVSAWRQRRSEPQPERQPESGRVLLPIQLPIQRDRNWKVLQRVSLDERQRSGVDGQSPVIDSSEDTRTSQVFADVWSISETARVDAQDTQEALAETEVEAPAPVEAEEEAPPAPEETEAAAPAVERLRRMLESEETVDAVSDDSTPQSTDSAPLST